MTARGWVLITGASRGLGAAMALDIAARGFDLVLWARSGPDLDGVAAAARELGADVRASSVDVTEPTQVLAAAERDLSGLPGLRAVVLNAGIGIWGRIDEFAIEDFRRTVDTNLTGAFTCAQAALPYLLRPGSPQVVVIASDSSRVSFAGRAAYCASKAGLLSLAETIRAELRSEHVRVTAVLPSRIDTYFRGKTPGGRADSLAPGDVAAVVGMLLDLPEIVEVRELSMSAITSTFAHDTSAAVPRG